MLKEAFISQLLYFMLELGSAHALIDITSGMKIPAQLPTAVATCTNICASEVTTLWRYTNVFIIIIIIACNVTSTMPEQKQSCAVVLVAQSDEDLISVICHTTMICT